MTQERNSLPQRRDSLDEDSSFDTGTLRAEGHLRKLCDAIVELLPPEPSGTSLLADVLPSFIPLVCSSLPTASTFRQELHGWELQSRQLLRLATLHGGAAQQELKNSLDRTAQLASRAIETFELLKTSARLVSAPEASEVSELTADPIVSSGLLPAESNLRELCLSLQGLLETSGERGSVLSQTMPSMLGVFSDCGAETLDQLKSERKSRETAVRQLLEIAAAHSGQAAKELRQRVAQSLASAARAIRSLEAMQVSLPPVTASDDGDLIALAPERGAPSEKPKNVSTGDKDRAAEFCQTAGRHQQQREFDSAEHLYGEALRLDAGLRTAYLHRGRVRLLTGKAELAIEDLNEAIRLSSDDSLGFSSRGDAYALCGRFSDAVHDYSSSLELRPDNRVVRYNRAVAFRQIGQLEQAWDELELLVGLDPGNAALYLNRGLICATRGERDRAIHEFRAAVASNPECQEAVDRLWELERARDADLGPAIGALKSASIPLTSSADSPPQSGVRKPITDYELEQILLEPIPEPPRRRRQFTLDDAAESPSEPDHARDSARGLRADTVPVQELKTSPVVSTRKSAGSALAKSASNLETIEGAFVDGSGDTAEPKTTGPASGSIATLTSTPQISLECPGCGAPSTVRWDRLQPGKVFGCRSCGGGFTSRDDGSLMLVQKGIDGKWRAFVKQPSLLYKSRWLLGANVAVILLFAVTLTWAFRPTRVVEPSLPEELELRAQLFAEAWVKRDYRIIRRMTDPGHAPQLFAWHKRNPAPEANRNLKIAVSIVKDVPPITTVSIRIDGVKSTDGTSRELMLVWKERDGEWLFVPTNDSRVASSRGTWLNLPVCDLFELCCTRRESSGSGRVTASEVLLVPPGIHCDSRDCAYLTKRSCCS